MFYMETNNTSPITIATERLDKIVDQFARGRITLSEYETQRLVILLDLIAASAKA